MFKQYEFNSMLNRFDTDKVSQKHIASYNIVKDITNANEILAEINPFEYCGYKLITENSIIKGIAITQKENTANVFRMSENDILNTFKDFFENQNSKIAHNAKDDIVLLKRKGIDLNNIIFDTMIGGYIINSSI